MMKVLEGSLIAEGYWLTLKSPPHTLIVSSAIYNTVLIGLGAVK